MARRATVPIHLPNNLKPLPIQIAYARDESGLGYLLRWVHKNHLSWRWLRGRLHIRNTRLPDIRDAPVLSYLSGDDLSHLQHSLMRSFGSAKDGGLMVYEKRVLYKDLYRVKHPQICAACIHQQGYISRFWEWGALPICPNHQSYLIDVCKYCNKRVTWDRPAIDVCQCGWPFSSIKESKEEPSAFEVAMAWHIHQRLSINNQDHMQSIELIPSWMRDLSLDALLRILKAFGICEKPLQVIPSSFAWRQCKCAFWIGVYQRACLRLSQFHEESSRKDLSDLVYRPYLELLASNNLHRTDKQAALYLLKALYDYEPLTHLGSGKGHLAQRSLFDWGNDGI